MNLILTITTVIIALRGFPFVSLPCPPLPCPHGSLYRIHNLLQTRRNGLLS